MSRDWRLSPWIDGDEELDERPRRPAPGKVALTQRLPASTAARPRTADASTALVTPAGAPSPDLAVQLRAADDAFGLHLESARVHEIAAGGVDGADQALPHADRIQASFGHHDVSGMRARVGGAAADASAAIGARAFAMGNAVAFAVTPDLHTAAHEAAHVVQQRGGVQLYGGVGSAGDPYEHHADRVADAVVRGESAEALLDEVAGNAQSAASSMVSGAIQRKQDDSAPPDGGMAVPPAIEAQVVALLEMPIAADDLAAAQNRVNAILVMVRVLHRAMRLTLLARLEKPKSGDQLATLFRHQLSGASRKRILAALRDETPASTEPTEPTEETAVAADDDDAAFGSGTTPVSGSREMWRHIVGERSSPVGKLARVRAPAGVRLRARPAAGAGATAVMPFDELVQVERRTDHGWCWVVALGSLSGQTGFCEEQFLSIDPPEPTAHLYRVQPGDALGAIAERYYGKSFRGGNDARLYVQALYEANKHHKGVYLESVDLGLMTTWHRSGAEENTLEIYQGAKVREGHAIWVPSEAFIQRLKSSGAITSGSSELSKAWRTVAAALDDAIFAATYAAGFTVGLLEGAWSAIADLFIGAAELMKTVTEVFYHLVTGNPGAIKNMLMDWVHALDALWTNRADLADAFMKKWRADDGWDRGNFQGEVLGWVMMTALITLATAGEALLLQVSGRWAIILRALHGLSKLGELGGLAERVLGKVPKKVADWVRRKLGRPGKQVDKSPGKTLGDGDGHDSDSSDGDHDNDADNRSSDRDEGHDKADGAAGGLAGHAAQAGMKTRHVKNLAKMAKKENKTIIFRSSNPASMAYQGKKGFRPKPPDVKYLKSAKNGPHEGLIVRPARPDLDQAAEIAKLESDGWKFDDDGLLRDSQGNAIHGDYDLQGVYQHDAGGGATKVDTNTKEFQKSFNHELDPNLKMVQHGANDDFKIGDPASMGRQPSVDETFIVTEPSGESRIVNGAAALQRYYGDHGFPWPYRDFLKE